jgi:hypothetical protein
LGKATEGALTLNALKSIQATCRHREAPAWHFLLLVNPAHASVTMWHFLKTACGDALNTRRYRRHRLSDAWYDHRLDGRFLA